MRALRARTNCTFIPEAFSEPARFPEICIGSHRKALAFFRSKIQTCAPCMTEQDAAARIYFGRISAPVRPYLGVTIGEAGNLCVRRFSATISAVWVHVMVL